MIREYENINELKPITVNSNSSKNTQLIDNICKRYRTVFIANDGRSGANNYTFGLYKHNDIYDIKSITELIKNETKYGNVYFVDLHDIVYAMYNRKKKPVGNHVFIEFNYVENVIIIDGIKYRVDIDKNNEYIFKIQKTKIKAIGGLMGLSKYIVENCHYDGAFNLTLYRFFNNIKNNVKPII